VIIPFRRRSVAALAFVLGLASVVLPAAAFGQAKSYALSTTDGLRLHNTTAEAVTFKDRKAVRVAVAPDVTRRPEYLAGTLEPEALVRIEGLAFSNGVIEVEIASAPAEGAGPGARGFAGIAFRLRSDERARRRSGTAQPRGAVHLAPRLDLVAPAA